MRHTTTVPCILMLALAGTLCATAVASEETMVDAKPKAAPERRSEAPAADAKKGQDKAAGSQAAAECAADGKSAANCPEQASPATADDAGKFNTIEDLVAGRSDAFLAAIAALEAEAPPRPAQR